MPRYAIFADIHSNLHALEAVLQEYRRESPDQYLCLGDVVGYAAFPNECVESIRRCAAVTIAGNHDWASVGLFDPEYFNQHALAAINWTKNTLDESSQNFLRTLGLVYHNSDLTCVHGTLDKPDEFNYLSGEYAIQRTFALLRADICFVGHTHVPAVFMKRKDAIVLFREQDSFDLEKDCAYIVNVGSVGQPRDGISDAAYCLYDSEKRTLRIKRACYDVSAARDKIVASGLPRFLGDRLLLGR